MLHRIHIIGRKNSGKTTLMVQLVELLSKQGLSVGTIKHTHHDHELDTPGKDSFRHREAGARAVGILSPKMNAVFWPQEPTGKKEPADSDSAHEAGRETARQADQEEKYAKFEPLMRDCDIVLVEGDSGTSATRVEVWRAENHDQPMCESDPTVAALVTDDARPTMASDSQALDLQHPESQHPESQHPESQHPESQTLVFQRRDLGDLVEWLRGQIRRHGGD